MIRRRKQQKEKTLSEMVASYISIQFKDTIFRFDVGADIKLTLNQAVHIKNKLKHDRGYPDLFIAEMRGGFGGLYLELKTSKDHVYTKKGEFRTDKHNVEQRQVHELLRKKGYKVEYGFGLQHTVDVIQKYMSLKD